MPLTSDKQLVNSWSGTILIQTVKISFAFSWDRFLSSGFYVIRESPLGDGKGELMIPRRFFFQIRILALIKGRMGNIEIATGGRKIIRLTGQSKNIRLFDNINCLFKQIMRLNFSFIWPNIGSFKSSHFGVGKLFLSRQIFPASRSRSPKYLPLKREYGLWATRHRN